ncbi:MAG: hypothetical protein KF845_08560 [Cyclobacteriaceae bacterium]|nr:hypothetical protein [Cyclobacteriaceae bacterium]
MKKYNKLSILFSAALIFGCTQEVAELKDPNVPSQPTGSIGANINVSKFVTIGNSLAAGLQSNALFTAGQNESIGKIIHQQMVYAGATGEFNQPDINSENGFSSFIPSTDIPLGRLVLFDPDGAGPRAAGPAPAGRPALPATTCPSPGPATEALPAPYNTALSPQSPAWAYSGDKTKLNNFGVPGITVGELLVPSSPNPAFGLYYASRFASNPGTSTILGDAVAAQPTFFLVEVGNNDVLGYATGGGSNPAILTSAADFQTRYGGVIATLLGNLPDAKGVVANIPYVTSIPFFFTVRWNNIPMDAGTAGAVNAGFAGYNQVLDGLKDPAFGGAFGTAAQLDARKVSFSASANNPILIHDKTLTDLGPGFDALTGLGMITPEQRAALEPYRQARQTTSTDLITLTAGSVLGTCVGGNPQAINGITVPLGDQYVLVPSEIVEIRDRVDAFNQIIANIVAGSGDRLALADVNAGLNNLVATQGTMVNGILLTPSITPPYAGFSEDGVHPNGRGYAFLANIFIDAINAKFGSTIPKADITKYRGTRTPISPGNSY